MARVKWFRARAARDRTQEEVEILQEEFKRTIRSFQRMSNVWLELGSCEENGRAAYAQQQSRMYSELAEDCRVAHQRVVIGRVAASDSS